MKKRTIIIILGLMLMLVISILYLSKDAKTDHVSVKNISIIIRGKPNERWENLKQGAEQAGTDLNANITFISLFEENSTWEQMELLKREIEGGADAILISPTDYYKMTSHINKTKKSVPVSLIESKVDKMDTLGYISCDNSEMGKDLAIEVIRHGNTRKNIVILDGGIQCSSVQERKKAFLEEIAYSKNKVIEWNESSITADFILQRTTKEKVDVFVALDDSVLEHAAKALSKYKETSDKTIELYGVGNSRDIINYLENDYIVSTAVQDDFSIGYLGVKNAMKAIKGEKMDINNQIAYAMIDREHMYSKENQRLLFPFVR